MDELFLFFAKSSGVLLLFLGMYFLLLRKETFFNENRFFLLGGMVFSLLIPFLVITKYVEIPTLTSITSNMFTVAGTPETVDTSVSWTTIILVGYVAGVLFFFGKFLVELASLCKLLWTSPVTKRDGQFIYIETTETFSPFSFFNYIVYNPELYSVSELTAILIHEQAHSRQLHSIDVFVAKLYCIFFWFNPLAWSHKKFILQNLEFLADSAAIKQTPSKKEYQLTLLKVSGHTYCPALTNNFYNSLIKKRIVMLQKTQSKHLNRWKQVLILPMLIAFVFLFNTEVIAKEIPTTTYTAEATFIEKEVVGDLVVVITKNTTVEELKAYKKLFSSQDIKFTYSDVDFNSKGEISNIGLVLTAKNMEAANGKFKAAEDKAITEIQLGKRDNQLFIKSKAFEKIGKGTYSYTVKSEYKDDDDSKDKTFIIRSNGGGNTSVNTWVNKKDIKTVDIKRENGKEVIIVNGKKLSPDEIIEEEIEIKNGEGNNFVFIGNSADKKGKDVEIEIISEEDNKIVFHNSGNKKPLIIIDGKQVKQSKMDKLDPNKIESVSVLKGDSAIEKYGEKGKDGVIIIKTKK